MAQKVIRIRPKEDLPKARVGCSKGCTLTDFYIDCKKAA